MLSVIVITRNEASHIERCLATVSWADEIIVLDSGSDDDTVDRCRKYTDKVFVLDWMGYGVQKQRALEKASGEWILSIDADEMVTPELRTEIEDAMQRPGINGFEIPRLSSYCGTIIRHGGWWPDYVLRLFKRTKGRFSDDLVHEKMTVEGTVVQLEQPLLHEAFIDYDEVLRKIDHYSSLNARQLYEGGARTSLLHAVTRGFWAFFRTYLLKASFLDGAHGFTLAVSNAEGTYYKYLKLLELQRRPGPRSVATTRNGETAPPPTVAAGRATTAPDRQ